VAALQKGTANPAALAAADFDADGTTDLVAGYSTKNEGVILFARTLMRRRTFLSMKRR